MADRPLSTTLPADLPTGWTNGQIIAPSGSSVGLATQYGYNYLMQQVNAAQSAANTINAAFDDLATEEQLPANTEIVYTLSASYSGTTHALTGFPAASGLISCVFTAAANYTAGDTFTVNGTPYTIQLSNGESAEDNLFVTGAAVPLIVDVGAKKVNFKAAGSGTKLPAETTAIVASYIANGTFLVPETGRYRITTVGKGGDGGRGDEDGAGGGGGSGGWACSELTLTKGTEHTVTVNASNSSFGNLLSATAGSAGHRGPGYYGDDGAGGSGGTASGGNVHNYSGLSGASRSGSTGGNGAAVQNPTLSKFLSSAGGVGGASEYEGRPPASDGIYSATGNGAGGGGKSRFSSNDALAPSGTVIIEFVLK